MTDQAGVDLSVSIPALNEGARIHALWGARDRAEVARYHSRWEWGHAS